MIYLSLAAEHLRERKSPAEGMLPSRQNLSVNANVCDAWSQQPDRHFFSSSDL
jgi:hypothetical protein